MINILSVFLVGVINITSGSLEIEKGERGIIYFLKNGVLLNFDSTSVTSDEGIYFIDEKWGKLYGHVRLKTPNYFIKADSLIYFEEGERTIFRLNVSGMDSSALFEAENIYVYGNTAHAWGNVFIFLVNDSVSFRGDSAIYFINLKEGKIFDRAEALLIERDSIILISDSLGFKKDSLIAWGNVTIDSKKFTGRSRKLLFQRIDETAHVLMTDDGTLDVGENHIEGDTLSFNLEKGEVRFASFSGSPTLRTGKQNGYLLVAGERMEVELAGDSIRFFKAEGTVKGEIFEK